MVCFVRCEECFNPSAGQNYYALAGVGGKAVEERMQIYRAYAQKNGLVELSIYEIPRIYGADYRDFLPPSGY